MPEAQPPVTYRWNPATLGNDKVVLVAAPRGSGKSVLVADLLWHKRGIPSGIAMSATEGSNRYYGNYLPPGFVYNQFEPEALQRVVNHQKEAQRRLEKRGYSQEEAKLRLPPMFIIIDDCVFDPRFRKDPTLQEIFVNGRHLNIFLVVVTQYINLLTPLMRVNVDVLFLLRDNNINVIKQYHQGYGGIIPKPSEFIQVFHTLTQNYSAMVITKSLSTRVEDCIFWYKAQIRPPFSTGTEEFWRVNRQLYDKRHGERARQKQCAVVRKLGYGPSGGGPPDRG